MVPLLSQSVLTFVMAGGKGERLWPMTKDRAKPAVPFGGIYRIIDFTLSNCVNSGLRRIHVLTQYKFHSLARHLRLGWNIFDSQLGEFIDTIPAQQRVDDHWYMGTADSIYQNIYTIEQERPSHVLILAGDHVYKMNYREMLDFHVQHQAEITISVVEMLASVSRQFGILQVDERSGVIGFEEKPAQPKTVPGRGDLVYASMGIYLFDRSVLEEELIVDAQRQGSSHDFGRDVIPAAIGRRRVAAYNFKDENRKAAKYWRDIGTLDAYYEANMDLVRVDPECNLYDQEWPIRTYVELAPPAKTVFAGGEDGSRIGQAIDSLISPGCIISGGRVERSVLSPHVRVNSYSLVQDTILMEGVNVGRHAKVRRAIVDKDVMIPPGTEIGYDAELDRRRFMVTDSGMVVVPKGTVIGQEASLVGARS